MILEHILNEFSFWLRIDKSRVETAIDSVKQMGYLSIPDLRQLSEAGIPIVQTVASVLGTNKKQVFELLSKGEDRITYQDLLLLLGIIASYFKYRESLHRRVDEQLSTQDEMNEGVFQIEFVTGINIDPNVLDKLKNIEGAFTLYNSINEMAVPCSKEKIEKRAKQSNEPFYYRFDKNKKSK